MKTTPADPIPVALRHKWKSLLLPLPTLAISFFILLIIFSTATQYKQQSRKDLKKDLLNILHTTQKTILFWKATLQKDLDALAALPVLTQFIQNPKAHQQLAQNALAPWIKNHKILDFAIYTKDKHGKIISHFKKDFQSWPVIKQAMNGFFALDESVFIEGDAQKVILTAATPIKSQDGKTVGVLAFSIDAMEDFAELIQLGSLGTSGETYAVNQAGRLITRKLPLKLKKDGLNLLLSSMKQNKTSYDLEGYSDYNGIKVVGAWVWDQELKLGFGTEIDEKEAYRTHEMIQRLTWIMITTILVAMLVFIYFQNLRNRNIWKIYSLQETNRARKDLLSIVSHDLKNPLSILLMTNELLLKTLPPDVEASEKRRKLLQAGNRAAEQMRRLITDLLDSAKIESGKLVIHPIKCDSKEIIQRSLDALQTLVEEKNIRIICDIPDNLPPLMADPERIAQVFSNLLSNAIKFSSHGGEIRIKVSHKDGVQEFSIQDNGVGMSEDDLTHLFERYWQAKQTQKFGTGLGLMICKELVMAHGGRIWVNSILKQGTTFTFTLPV